MPLQSIPSTDIHAAVSAAFSNRPTLRQVVAREALKVLVERSAVIESAQLEDASALVLNIPSAHTDYPSWNPRPLVDVLLQAMAEGSALHSLGNPGAEFMLSVAPPYHFKDGAGDPLEFTVVSVQQSLDALDDLLLMLPELFRQAQVDYWQGSGSLGVSRDAWLQQQLKAALLGNLPLQGLDQRQTELVLGALKGDLPGASAWFVQVRFEAAGDTLTKMLPNLLICSEWDDEAVLLWCAPSGVIRGSHSQEDFAAWLCEALGVRTLRWDRFQLEGDVFAQQAALLLDLQLQGMAGLEWGDGVDVDTLETAFSALSDPAQYFVPGYSVSADKVRLQVPPGVVRANADVSFAYQCGLFELALAQTESQGQDCEEGVLDLQGFARDRLRKALLEDYPVEANYLPDDLILTLSSAQGIPTTGWGSIQQRTMSLTEFAIGNLASLHGEVLAKIEHRENQLIMPWLTPDYVKTLVEKVDIGGEYPAYVARLKDEMPGKVQRVVCFAREWRCSLLFSGLTARLDNKLSEAGLECLVDFIRGRVNRNTPATVLMPLALQRTPGPEQEDRVHGMYVLFAAELNVVLLYRPLYPQNPLLEFTSIKAMLAAIGQPGSLQDSVLEWIGEASRDAYGKGDFASMFLPELPGSTVPVPVKVTFAAAFWLLDVDVKLYQASLDLLIELAGRKSLSTAQSRWATLLRGGWLLFDTLTLFVGGPVAVVAWLAQGVGALRNDLPALLEGSAFERSAAVVDLLLGLAGMLMHRSLPKVGAVSAIRAPVSVESERALAVARLSLVAPHAPEQGKVYLPGELGEQPGLMLDFSFRGAEGFNVLGPELSQKVRAMQSPIDLSGHSALADGPTTGVYRVDGKHYVKLAGDSYRVQVSGDQVRIIDGHGEKGPLLHRRFGAWRIDGGLQLRGGMPKSRLQQLKEQNAKKLARLKEEDKRLVLESRNLKATFEKHRVTLRETTAELRDLQALSQPSDGQNQRRLLLLELVGRYREVVVYDAKAMIDNAIVHDKVLDDISVQPHREAVLEQAVKESRGTLRRELILDCESFYNEMAKMINDANVGELADDVSTLPESTSEIQLYREYRKDLERVVKWQVDLVTVARQFDVVLEKTLRDDTIHMTDEHTGKEKQAWLKGIIDQRSKTGIELEFELLLDLGELCLDRLGVGVQEHVLVEYEGYLVGAGLRSAGAAHGDPGRAEVTLDEQINILTGVVEAYGEADALASYLRSLGGLAVDSKRLDQYRALLGELKDNAEKELIAAVQEQQVLPEQRRVRQPIYAPRGGRRHVVRTQRGRAVMGEERELDGNTVLVQRDDRANVLKTFHRQGSLWVEELSLAAEPRRASLDLAQERGLGNVLIEQVESVIRLSKQYEKNDEPLGMATVIDGHVDKLRDVLASIPRSDDDQSLLQNLSKAIERLEAVKRDKTVSLYLASSHPTAESLRYLLEQDEVTVSRQGERVMLSQADYLDVYEVRRKAHGTARVLWEAHFHYLASDTAQRQFSKGHLKLAYQSKLGREAQLRAAASGKEMLAIYRGNLRLADVEGLIPFEQ